MEELKPKLLEENIVNPMGLGIKQSLFRYNLKSTSNKRKIDKLTLSKFKTFELQKTLKKMQTQLKDWEKHLQNKRETHKGLSPECIKNSQSSVGKQPNF